MTPIITPATRRASFAIGNEQAAKRVVDLLNESFFEGQAAIAAFEGAGGRWEITVHFAEAPDEGSIRELVGLAAGDDIARDVAFDTVDAKDWVKATLEELVPVRAGRFVVHGRHDRARVPPNKLGIEIEAALAFGTGHHGTTRGCLLLLDEVLKAYRPRRVLDLGTGTGVLGIAAAKALRIDVLASDIDPLSVRVARGKRQTQRYGRSGAGDPRHRLLGAAIRAARTVRSRAGEHSRQSVAANGNADGAPSGTIGAGHSIRAAAASGQPRRRRLSRARTDPGATTQYRRLEQPAVAQGRVKAQSDTGYWRRANTFFSSRRARLTRFSTNRSKICTMTPRCFFLIDGIGPRRAGGEIFSNVKAGMVYPLVVELKHSWNSPRLH